jgi:hypothetical protein
MKKITVEKAHQVLVWIANGINPAESGTTQEEVMLSAAMGAVAIQGLGKVGSLATEMAEAAVFFTQEVKKLEGDVPVSCIKIEGVNGS